MEPYPVGSLNELAQSTGCRKIVRVHGLELGIFYVADQYRAYRNVCPHAGAPVCAGQIESPESGAQDESPRFVLRCPWHGWEFDLETGRCLLNPQCQLISYPVKAVGETLFVLI
jgi:nitrite reductase (NADH) small subunit